MTLLQLKLAITINECGSISSASNKLNISQSNSCSYLKQLENEIGYEIFNRTKSGTTLTEKGYFFLEHAKRILAEKDSIMAIKKENEKYRLRLGTINYSSPIETFIDLCESHRDDIDADICFSNVSVDEGIKALNNYKLDIIIAPVLKTQITGIKNQCNKYDLSMISICEVPAYVFMRKDHPAIKDGKLEVSRGSDILKEYPYVAYRNLNNDNIGTAYNDSDFIPCSYKIFVDGRDVRFRVIESTNAFSFGVMPLSNVKEKYDVAYFPVDNISIDVLCLIRNGDINKKELNEFITLFKKSLEEKKAG